MLEHRLRRVGLVGDRNAADLLVDRLPKRFPARGVRAAVVDTRDSNSMLGQQTVPQVGRSAVLVQHGLPRRFTVDVHQQRNTLGSQTLDRVVFAHRHHDPHVQLHVLGRRVISEFTDGQSQEFRVNGSELFEVFVELLVVIKCLQTLVRIELNQSLLWSGVEVGPGLHCVLRRRADRIGERAALVR